MNINFAIDWLAFNSIGVFDLNHQAIAYQPELWSWIECKGTFGYDKATETSDKARVMWSTTRQDMGTFISYPGRALSSYRDRGISAVDIIKSALADGSKCKRIDLAIDAVDSKFDIAAHYKILKRGDADTHAKKYSLISSSTGDTLYIGSRESEQFIRIYDKAKEQGDMIADRVRFEIELKGSRAEQFAALLLDMPETEAARRTQQLINSVVSFNTMSWVEIMGTENIGIAKAKDNQADTEKWLLQSVAPAMAKYIKSSGRADVMVRFNRIVVALAELDITPTKV